MRVLVVSDVAQLKPALDAELLRRAGALACSVELDFFDADRVAAEDTQLRGALAGARVVLADPGLIAPLVDDAAPELEWLQSTWAGVNALMSQSQRRDYACTRMAGCFGPLMAEWAVGWIIASERRFLHMAEAQRSATWAHSELMGYRPLADLTLGVLGGGGNIGRCVAATAAALGMRTVSFGRGDDLALFLAECDVVMNLLPSTPATRNLLGGGVLRHCAMRRPLLLNGGRGDVVNEHDLLHALEARWLREVVLDVFAAEPLPPSSALWAHPAVVVSPHTAARSLPVDVARLFGENLERWLAPTGAGKPLAFLVDWEKGY
jgi:phosphoglycerate dehydrogenase-like enzyme